MGETTRQGRVWLQLRQLQKKRNSFSRRSSIDGDGWQIMHICDSEPSDISEAGCSWTKEEVHVTMFGDGKMGIHGFPPLVVLGRQDPPIDYKPAHKSSLAQSVHRRPAELESAQVT